ncbi:hypothetical protein GLOIN_2v1791324 [Rhizophagus irregularis DAOM 181602=DAOM 197198]|nr:hypothetical protein GLOIN_2v1791324 [Rhizophagus irregularis DAOM 181602=DAOM 197198]
MTEKQVILYTKQLLINGDDKIVVDLHNVNKSRPEQFSEFWKYIKQYLKEYAALKMRFSPNNEAIKVSEYYTEKLGIKYMVQTRQLCIDHPNFHYASALF